MAREDTFDPQSLLQAIAAARDEAGSIPQVQLTFERRYDPAYWLDQAPEPEWMPQVAEIGAVVSGGAALWRELEITVASGPRDMYRYFPFVCYIYVDGRAASVIEFAEEEQECKAVVSVPVGKAFTMSIVSELCRPPTEQDERELAIVLRGLRVGEATHAPRTDAPDRVNVFSQHAVPLVEVNPRPIFVVGPYRSGTSILTWALGQHPNIWPLDETRWLQLLGSGALAAYAVATDASTNYFDTYNVSKEEYMAHLGSAIDQFMVTTSKRRAQESSLKRLSGLAPRFDRRFRLRRSAFGAKERWIDGTPENAECILLLHELFPAARFVCIVREPYDVIASMLHFHRAGGSAMDVETAAGMWLQKTRSCMLAYQALGPRYIHVLRYEALSDPAPALHALFEYLDEPDFPAAADTFTRRINSSSVLDDERQAAYAEIAASSIAKAVTELHASFMELLARPWEYESAAHQALSDAQNEIVNRMVESVV